MLAVKQCTVNNDQSSDFHRVPNPLLFICSVSGLVGRFLCYVKAGTITVNPRSSLLLWECSL